MNDRHELAPEVSSETQTQIHSIRSSSLCLSGIDSTMHHFFEVPALCQTSCYMLAHLNQAYVHVDGHIQTAHVLPGSHEASEQTDARPIWLTIFLRDTFEQSFRTTSRIRFEALLLGSFRSPRGLGRLWHLLHLRLIAFLHGLGRNSCALLSFGTILQGKDGKHEGLAQNFFNFLRLQESCKSIQRLFSQFLQLFHCLLLSHAQQSTEKLRMIHRTALHLHFSCGWWRLPPRRCRLFWSVFGIFGWCGALDFGRPGRFRCFRWPLWKILSDRSKSTRLRGCRGTTAELVIGGSLAPINQGLKGSDDRTKGFSWATLIWMIDMYLWPLCTRPSSLYLFDALMTQWFWVQLVNWPSH